MGLLVARLAVLSVAAPRRAVIGGAGDSTRPLRGVQEEQRLQQSRQGKHDDGLWDASVGCRYDHGVHLSISTAMHNVTGELTRNAIYMYSSLIQNHNRLIGTQAAEKQGSR